MVNLSCTESNERPHSTGRSLSLLDPTHVSMYLPLIASPDRTCTGQTHLIPTPPSHPLLSDFFQACRPQPEPAGPHLRQQVHPHHRQRQRAPAPCLGQLLHGPARSCPAHACRPGVLLPPPHPCIPLPDPLRGHCSLLLGRHGEQFFSGVMVSKLGWGLGTASGLGAGA